MSRSLGNNEFMTGRQRVEAALSAQGTTQIPAVLCYEGIYIRDHWPQLTRHPWWYAQSPDIEQQLAWRRDVIHAMPQDWFILPVVLPRAEREALRIEVAAGEVYRVEQRTGSRERLIEPRVGGWGQANLQSVQPDHPPQTPEQIDAAIPIPPPPTVEQMRGDGRGDLAARLLAEFGEQLWPFCHVISPLWNCYRLWGFEGMMTRIADEPALVLHACERYLALTEQRIREAAVLGTAGVWIEECFTDLVSPEVFASINLPLVARMVRTIRASDMKSIYYYCGDPARRWDLILSAGADAISFEESKKNFVIDIEEVVQHVQGRCCVLGNLDAVGVLQDADEAGLRTEVARQIAAGMRNGRRFIMSLGSPVTPGTPTERVRLYCEMAGNMHDSMVRQQIAYYRARAHEYDEWFLRRGRYDGGPEINTQWFSEIEQVQRALDAFLPGGSVLELACGTGLWTQRLLEHARHITAVDASPEMLALNQQRIGSPRVRYVHADLFGWRPGEKYDVVFFSFWLSHVPPERFAAFWEFVAAALNPEGRVFFIDSLYEPTSTAADHRLGGQEATTVSRTLNDGRVFEIVKLFYIPDDLATRLATLGWQAQISGTEHYFLHGQAMRGKEDWLVGGVV